MWRYGEKLIRHLFKKRTESQPIRVVLESKIQADRDRSDIRVFETGVSSQRYGDHEQGTRAAAQETEGERLISIAKDYGLFIPKLEWSKFGDRKRLPSGESIVYLNEEGDTITKIRNPFAKAVIKNIHAQDVIYEHLIHNILFPSTSYKFIGISEDTDGVRIILQQQYLPKKFSTPSQKDIDDYLLKGLGLNIEDRYFYANEYIAITDVSADGDNVLSDNEHLLFIDPIIKFKQPAIVVLNHYYEEIQGSLR